MIVCHCHRVSDRTLDRAIKDGAGTVRELCGRTGAGRGCGGCLESLRDRLADLTPREPLHAAS